MLIRDGHCAQCGLHVDKDNYDDFRMGAPCPDPACPSHNRKQWQAWYSNVAKPEFEFGPVDWVKLRAWVEPFKRSVRAELDLPELDEQFVRRSTR